MPSSCFSFFFFFNDTATTEIYTLSLHDALPIWGIRRHHPRLRARLPRGGYGPRRRETRRNAGRFSWLRSEEHTSELQSPCNLVCRLLLEKKKHDQQPRTQQCREELYSRPPYTTC